jgi:2'-5' RNA ligase
VGDTTVARKNKIEAAVETPGRDALWLWFGLSYASWLTIPRVLMHEMPDEWQEKMAALLNEYDEHWNFESVCDYTPHVTLRKGRRFAKTPDWLVSYRHPHYNEIKKLRSKGVSDGTPSKT